MDVVVLKIVSRPWEQLEYEGGGDEGGGGVGYKFVLAQGRKEQGNALLKQGYVRLAMAKYQAAQMLLEYEETDDSEELFEEDTCEIRTVPKSLRDRIGMLKVALLLNLAVCWQVAHVRLLCTRVAVFVVSSTRQVHTCPRVQQHLSAVMLCSST